MSAETPTNPSGAPKASAPQAPTQPSRGSSGGRRFGAPRRHDPNARAEDGYRETVVAINRVSKTVKGGKRFSFAALIVIGDGAGTVGFGLGKAREVQGAILKANHQARKNIMKFPLVGDTIPHEIVGKFCAGKVWMKPAAPGTGVIAGGGVRAVLEAGGVRNVLTKSLGSNNAFNVVGATLECLRRLRTSEATAKLRGK